MGLRGLALQRTSYTQLRDLSRNSQSPVMRSWEWLCAPENGGRPPGPTGQPGNPINEVQAPGLMTDPVLTNAVECGGGQPHPHHTQEKASEMCTSSLGGWVRHQSLSTLRAAVP